MVNQIPAMPRPAYMGTPGSLQNLNLGAMENIPVAGKIGDERTRASQSIAVMAGGMMAGPMLGRVLDLLSGPNGTLIKIAQSISDTKIAQNFNNWVTRVKPGEQVSKLLSPLKLKIFKGENLKLYKEGYNANRGILASAQASVKSATEALAQANILKEAAKEGTKEAARAAKQLAKATSNMATAEATLKSTTQMLGKIEKMGVLGRAFGKTGLFFKKHLTGTMGIFNGLFAAMTVNSVIQAKKGEKVSTLMEDVMGTWVGSMGGFSIFNGVLNGLMKFVDPVTKTVTAKGVLPTIAKIVNKIPAKQFVFPLIGAIVLSTVLQKVSHAVFGKPTKEDPALENQNKDSMNDFLNKTGWSNQEFDKIRQAQGLPPVNKTPVANNPANNNQPQAQQNQANNGYKGYMPKAEVPETVIGANDAAVNKLLGNVDGSLADMAQDLKRYGIEI